MHNSPAVSIQTHKVFLLKRHTQQRDLVTRLVCGSIKPLGLQNNKDGAHKILHPLLHIGVIFKGGIEGHIRTLLLRNLPLKPEHQQPGVIQRGAVHFLLAVEALSGLGPLLGRATGGDGNEAHHLAVCLEVAPLVVLGQVVVAVSDVEEALRVSDVHLAHTGDALVNPEELVLGYDAYWLDHNKHRLVVLSTLHVVWDTHIGTYLDETDNRLV